MSNAAAALRPILFSRVHTLLSSECMSHHRGGIACNWQEAVRHQRARKCLILSTTFSSRVFQLKPSRSQSHFPGFKDKVSSMDVVHGHKHSGNSHIHQCAPSSQSMKEASEPVEIRVALLEMLSEAQSSDQGATLQSEPRTTPLPSSPQSSLLAPASVAPPFTPSPQVTPNPLAEPLLSAEDGQPYTRFALSVPQDFDLEKAVVSYGFFMAAPNRWLFPPGLESGCLERPLRLADGQAVWVRIGPMKAEESGVLLIEVGVGELGDKDREVIQAQVQRMLRLLPEDSAAVAAFQAMHLGAKAAGFGRLFRSPTLWEDVVKTQLLCNCGWGRTLSMNRALCQLQAELNGPPLGCPTHLAHLGDFPTAAELQNLAPAGFSKKCGLGYRAARLVSFAKGVASGVYDLGRLEGPGRSGPAPELLAALLKMPGLGPFSAANVMQCLGEFERVAADSETARHLREVHRKYDCDDSNVEKVVARVYQPYAPYQFLAYWYEIWQEYEALFGPLSRMSPDDYPNITGRNMSNQDDGRTKKATKEKKAPRKGAGKKRVAVEGEAIMEAGPSGATVGTAGESVPETATERNDVGAPATPVMLARRSGRKRGKG